MRTAGDAKILVVTPRLAHRLAQSKGATVDDRAIWLGTSLSLPESATGTTWKNLFTGKMFEGDPTDVGTLFTTMPVAVLVSDGENAING
jgi:maltooligosyltrehalose synthase